VVKKQTAASGTTLASDGLKRDVGLLGLLWVSEGSIIGSGWLLGAFTATTIAGPAALLAWIVGSVAIVILPLVYAELGGLFPVSGGSARFPHYAFGSLAGASFGWFAWLQAIPVAPIEVEAALQYATHWHIFSGYVTSDGTLTASGFGAAVVLMAVFVTINLFGVRWLSRTNSYVAAWKVIIPVMTALVLLITHFHGSNFSADGGFFIKGPQGGAHSILQAVSDGGIVFALIGFEQAVQIGGESANPKRDLPRAVLGSVLIASVMYILLQIAFVGAIEPSTFTRFHSWSSLMNDGALATRPFYTIATAAGLGWLAWLLLIDAVISPSGDGLLYMTTSSRISYGLSKTGYVPRSFERTSARSNVPLTGLLFTFLVGLLVFLPFPSWQKLVGFISSATVIMYAGAPLAFGALRLQKPDLTRPYKVPLGKLVAPVSFILANYIIYWSGWDVVWRLMAAILLGYVLIGISMRFKLNGKELKIDWRAGCWLFPYLVGMTVISWLGSFGGGKGDFLGGGMGHLGLWSDLLVLGIFSLIVYYVAMALRLAPGKVNEYAGSTYSRTAAPDLTGDEPADDH
jgi:amino acid transporter